MLSGSHWKKIHLSMRPKSGSQAKTLDGLVLNETMKQMAERDAWYMLGVKEVVNRVRVER